MLTALAAALSLSLEPGAPRGPPPPAWAAQGSQAEVEVEAPRLRSSLWVPAGGYGMAMTFAGSAAILTEYSTRRVIGRRTQPPLVAMCLGFLGGLVPGLLLGQNAREDDNTKNRGAVTILDLVGTLSVGIAFKQIYRPE